jgi:hypothetical protein
VDDLDVSELMLALTKLNAVVVPDAEQRAAIYARLRSFSQQPGALKLHVAWEYQVLQGMQEAGEGEATVRKSAREFLIGLLRPRPTEGEH